MSEMILYHGQPNGPSLAVLAALFETGLDVELRPINLLGGERHSISGLTAAVARDMGIEGEGPVLVKGGEAMTESVFIAQFLDETAGGAGLQPSDPYVHWQMLMWCRRITERGAPAAAWLGCKTYAHPAFVAVSDADFDTISAGIVSEDLRQRWVDVRQGNFPEAATSDSETKLGDSVYSAETQLADGRDWLMGDFSLADLESYAWLAGMVALVPDAFAAAPLTDAWLARVAARPSVQRALALATIPDPRHSWAPGPEINRWG